MTRVTFAGIVAIALFAIAAGQASAASVHWGEDARWGAQVWVLTAPGERVDLTIHAEGPNAGQPKEIVVENAAGTLATPGTLAAPGSCDSHESDCDSACRAETPQRARCNIYDGYTRDPDPVNPLESPRWSFAGVWLYLDSGDDRVTVPADNPVRFRLFAEPSGGSNTWNLARVIGWVEANDGDAITSGPGANVEAVLWGANNTVRADNGRADSVFCPFGDSQTIRLDVHDRVDDCTGDIQPAPSPVGPLPAPPDVDEAIADQSQRLGNSRRCIEANVAAPGSCITPLP